MRRDKTLSMDAAGVLPFGAHVYAKYRGSGRIKVPTHDAMAEPHFDEDYYVEWESGGHSWLGKEVLQIVK